jgi:PAS domain S-box-containing protein
MSPSPKPDQNVTATEALLSSVTDGIFELDQHGQIVHFNESAAEIIDCRPGDMLGKDYRDVLTFVSERTGMQDNSFIVAAQRGNPTQAKGHVLLIGKGARKIPVTISAVPLKNPTGGFTGVMVVFRDIAKQLELRRLKKRDTVRVKESADKILAEQTKSEALINSIGDGLVFTNQYGEIVNVNNSAARLMGYSERDMVNRKISEIIPMLDKDGHALDPLDQPAVKALSTGLPVSVKGYYRKQDRTMIAVSVTVSPVVVDGDPIGAVEAFRDITKDVEMAEAQARAAKELKRRADEIEREQKKAEAMLKSIGDGLIVSDQYGEITRANASAHRLLGFEAGALIGKRFTKAVLMLDESDDPIPPLERPMLRAISTGKPITMAGKYQRFDKSELPVSITVSPVIVEGEPIGAVEVFRDITEQRELDQAKDEFVSLASHQLRTPATGVKAFLSMVLEGDVGKITKQQHEFISKAYDSNERELSLITDLLMVARADANRMQVKIEPTDVSKVVDSIVEESMETIKGRRQKIKVDRPDQPVKADLDADKIKMVVDNFVSNASKYTPEGGSIKVRLEGAPESLRITVSDSGVGIPEADIKRLFTKFTRIDNVLSAKVEGTGLGLYLAKKIVDFHHGHLKVTSTVGQGSTFAVELPKKQPKGADGKKNTDR